MKYTVVDTLTFRSPPHSPVVSRSPRGGVGFLCSTFPDSTAMIEGVPTGGMEIRVLYRPSIDVLGDSILVATTMTAQDGSWRVNNLNPELRFDVVCRYNGFKDEIMSNIQPFVE